MTTWARYPCEASDLQIDERLRSGTRRLPVLPSRTAHSKGGGTAPQPGPSGAELGQSAPSQAMNRCPRRCRSPLGQAARSLYQLVTGSLSPGMRQGREGQDPSKNEWLGIGVLQRWREGIRRNRGSHIIGVRTRSLTVKQG